jgi:hypothetical protein
MTMKPTLDRNLFTQVGLDSASLTMLGSTVHTFSEPGEYRGALHRGSDVKAVFYINVDKSSAAAHATVDLSALENGDHTSSADGDCPCSKEDGVSHDGKRFVVNPRGYTLFHASSGVGGYYVNIRRIDAPQTERGYDSRVLCEGDVFSAILLRPGTYSLTNALTKATGEIVVSYPRMGEKAYRPPNPVRIDCGPKSFELAKIPLQPGQGMLFHAKVPSHIVIRLTKADDGPSKERGIVGRAGWKSPSLR